jgi:endonuclease YncB( thermonuclease family)
LAKGTLKYAMSRRCKNAIIVVMAIFAVGLVCIDRLYTAPFRREVLLRVPRPAGAAKYHLKTFKVVNIVDGDTVDIDIPDGKYKTTRVRLLGVDTPETKKRGEAIMYFGPEASAFVTGVALGKNVTVIIDTVSDVRDRYGRLLGYIRLPDKTILNEEIIRQGFGYADLRFKHNDYDSYVDMMDSAISGKVGLWKNVERKQMPKWLQRERPMLLK